MKRQILFILTLLFCIFFGSALADGNHLRTKLMPVPDYVPLRSGASIGGTTSGETGIEYTFTVNNGTDEGVVYYRFAVAILDNTYTDGAADTLYDEYYIAPRDTGEFAYTFYLAGTYGIWCYRYDEDMNLIPWTTSAARTTRTWAGTYAPTTT